MSADEPHPLRYGLNPHQAPARAEAMGSRFPFRVRNGDVGYVNLLDALMSWQLVRELSGALGLPAAASFKHVNPAGAAVGLPVPDCLRRACHLEETDLTPLAGAYVRARSADRLASYGDWVALSEPCDLATARVLRPEASDGIIAPGFAPDAFELLSEKRGGAYRILEVDPAFEPPPREARDAFGVRLTQPRNDRVPEPDDLGDVVTADRELPEAARRDLVVAAVTAKYGTSNCVVLVLDGQAVGVGSGQQSRIAATRLACEKAELWHLRQRPEVVELGFRPDAKRPERDTAIDLLLRGELRTAGAFAKQPEPISGDQRRELLRGLRGVALASDGLIPFRDNIDRAARSGVRYILQPGGSARDAEVTGAADDQGTVMVMTGTRHFAH